MFSLDAFQAPIFVEACVDVGCSSKTYLDDI